MRRYHRPALAVTIQEQLSDLQRSIDAHAHDPGEHQQEANRFWEQHRERVLFSRGILPALERMNDDDRSCMYCGWNEAPCVDHFWPKSRYPHRTFVWENYFLACDPCNRKKSARFPMDSQGQPLLIELVLEDPHPELSYSLSEGKYDQESSTERGQACIDVFDLNRSQLIRNRKRVWNDVKNCLECYATAVTTGDDVTRAEKLEPLLFPPRVAIFQEVIFLYKLRSPLLTPAQCAVLAHLQQQQDVRLQQLFR